MARFSEQEDNILSMHKPQYSQSHDTTTNAPKFHPQLKTQSDLSTIQFRYI
eukprot:m.418028 g.418028  ORF g.418028 m.418028 type:complete len:51 (+) comp21288_c0_seq50:1979-2131(+)